MEVYKDIDILENDHGFFGEMKGALIDESEILLIKVICCTSSMKKDKFFNGSSGFPYFLSRIGSRGENNQVSE